MDLRAKEEIPNSEDLIPPLPPLIASLHSRYLKSKCSSCFKSLDSRIPTQSINRSCSSCSIVSYCSASCSAADLPLHFSSGECLLLQYHPSIDADARAAVRLSKLGLSHESSRVGWLSVAEGLDDDDRIRSWSEMIRSVLGFIKEGKVEEVMAAVVSNAVEIVVGEERLGIGVYGFWFSWFNHSCSPNACYRFECFQSLGCESEDSNLFRVFPASREGEPNADELSSANQVVALTVRDAGGFWQHSRRRRRRGSTTGVTIWGLCWLQWKRWAHSGSNLTQDICLYGPRIVVRSIKPIKKNEEVCIAYTDLLQPKAVRLLDLWSEYRFSCSCIRCSASPEMFIDYILNADLRSLTTTQSNFINTDCSEISDHMDQIIDEYMSDGNAKACCRKLEQLLSENFKCSPFQEPFRINFKLHPLHHLSLNSYTVLSSAFKISSANESNKLKAFNMGRASAAYSLLLAGSTHYLFMTEPSLIASVVTYWVNAGETILDFIRNRCGVNYILSEGRRERTSFLKYISKNLTQSWQYLARGLPYLENITNPIDFKWLGLRSVFYDSEKGISDLDCLDCEYKIDAANCVEETRRLAEIAVCCMSYGRYLAIMCWGEENYLVGKVNNLILV